MKLAFSFIATLILPTLSHAISCSPLLILSRSTNSNRVWYEWEESADAVNPKWEMREKGSNVWEKLTSFENSSLYGIRMKTPDSLFIAGFPALEFEVSRGKNGISDCPALFRKLADGTPYRVETLDAQLSPGFLFPKLNTITVRGHDLQGQPTSERLDFLR